VEITKRQIYVRRGVFNPAGGGFVFQPPKTKLGKRTVQLGQGITDHLRAQLQLVDFMRKSARDKWQENDLVFPSDVGTPIGGDRITHEFPILAKMAGLPVIRLHDCHHTAASIMRSLRIPPIIVAGMLGHSLAILMTIYAHIARFARYAPCGRNIPGTQDEADRLMDDIIFR
jgi:integrase